MIDSLGSIDKYNKKNDKFSNKSFYNYRNFSFLLKEEGGGREGRGM